jgi:hypothetical protein
MSDVHGEVAGHGGVPWRLVGIIGRGRFRRMQMLEDAIAWREARSSRPCGECSAAGPDRRCGDHARDVALIASYQHEIRMSNLGLGPPPGRPADPGA